MTRAADLATATAKQKLDATIEMQTGGLSANSTRV
jgi:hypothetical protein